MEVTGTITAWTVDQCSKNEYIIWGEVSGHYKFPEGCQIHTSGVKNKDFPVQNLKAGMIVTTRNSTYMLGDTLEDYMNKNAND